MYDHLDMKENYHRGFWIGALSGVMSSFLVCLLVGLYLSN